MHGHTILPSTTLLLSSPQVLLHGFPAELDNLTSCAIWGYFTTLGLGTLICEMGMIIYTPKDFLGKLNDRVSITLSTLFGTQRSQ